MERETPTDRGFRVIAKASRAPILVVRTGTPLESYPSRQLSFLLMLYAESIQERELLRHESEAILEASRLEAVGPEVSSRRALPLGLPITLGVPISIRLPVRRGCWRYDDVLGPWQSWYPLDKDYL